MRKQVRWEKGENVAPKPGEVREERRGERGPRVGSLEVLFGSPLEVALGDEAFAVVGVVGRAALGEVDPLSI